MPGKQFLSCPTSGGIYFWNVLMKPILHLRKWEHILTFRLSQQCHFFRISCLIKKSKMKVLFFLLTRIPWQWENNNRWLVKTVEIQIVLAVKPHLQASITRVAREDFEALTNGRPSLTRSVGREQTSTWLNIVRVKREAKITRIMLACEWGFTCTIVLSS